jgi:hypothetical protein
MANLAINGASRTEQILIDQINARTRQVGITNNKIPAGLKNGDFTSRIDGENIYIGQSDGHSLKEYKITQELSQYLGMRVGTTDPNIENFPNDSDWGWYKNNNDPTKPIYFIARNDNGTIVLPNFSGTSGTITDAQHGARGNGDLHTIATTSVNGFMPSTDRVFIKNVSETSAALYSLNCNKLYLNGDPIIENQLATIGKITYNPSLNNAVYNPDTTGMTLNQVANRLGLIQNILCELNSFVKTVLT